VHGGAGAVLTLRNTSILFAQLLAWTIGERPGRAGIAAACIAGDHLCYKQSLALGSAPAAVFALSLGLAGPLNVLRIGAIERRRLVAEMRRRPLFFLASGAIMAGSFLIFLFALVHGGAGAVLTLRNMASERGDRRFQRVRQEGIGPVLDALAARIREGQARGAVSKALHPYAAAAALAAILDRMAAHHRDIGFFGVTRDDLRETCARILLQTLAGRAPSE